MSMKMTLFPIFGLKWNIIAHSTLTYEWKPAAMNEMNRTGIQLSFDITFMPVSLMVKLVFSSLKQKFAAGDLLVAGFESRTRQNFSQERYTKFSHMRGPIENVL